MADEHTLCLRVMADYGCFPLWDDGTSGPRNVDPRQLSITSELAAELQLWAASYDQTHNAEDPPSSGFATREDHSRFVETGRQLASRLSKELGPAASVSYFDDLTDDLEEPGPL